MKGWSLGAFLAAVLAVLVTVPVVARREAAVPPPDSQNRPLDDVQSDCRALTSALPILAPKHRHWIGLDVQRVNGTAEDARAQKVRAAMYL